MNAQPHVHARAAFWIVAPEPPERRLIIEAALERLDGLRDRLIGKLDAMDTDADLEPSLSFPEAAVDQSNWALGCRDDLEVESDFESEDFHECPWPDEGDQSRLRRRAS